MIREYFHTPTFVATGVPAHGLRLLMPRSRRFRLDRFVEAGLVIRACVLCYNPCDCVARGFCSKDERIALGSSNTGSVSNMSALRNVYTESGKLILSLALTPNLNKQTKLSHGIGVPGYLCRSVENPIFLAGSSNDAKFTFHASFR